MRLDSGLPNESLHFLDIVCTQLTKMNHRFAEGGGVLAMEAIHTCLVLHEHLEDFPLDGFEGPVLCVLGLEGFHAPVTLGGDWLADGWAG